MPPFEEPSAEDESDVPGKPRIRLQRFLAACGLGSRRACEQFILDGRVTVDGQTIAELGATVDPASQTIALDGEKLRMERKRYYILNKPPGFLCTNFDPAGRRRAIDLLPSDGPRLFTIGRLDENSTGLLFVTNDGDLAEKLAHPRNQIFRTYHVQVAGHPKRESYEALKQGLHFSEGRFRVRAVKPLKKVGQSTWLEVILSEGHNRELRRLFARVGHKVLKLTRVAFGPVRLGKLKMGEFRDLTMAELGQLHEMVSRAGKPRDPRRPPGGERKSPRDRKSKGDRRESRDWPAFGDRKAAGDRTGAGARKSGFQGKGRANDGGASRGGKPRKAPPGRSRRK